MEEKKVMAVPMPMSGEWGEYRNLVLWEFQHLRELSQKLENGMDKVEKEVMQTSNKIDSFITIANQHEVRIAKVEKESADNSKVLLELRTKIGVWGTFVGLLSSVIFEAIRIFFSRV